MVAAAEGFWVKKNSSHKSWLIYAAFVVQNMVSQNFQQEIYYWDCLRSYVPIIYFAWKETKSSSDAIELSAREL